jgi:hypothetical protein
MDWDGVSRDQDRLLKSLAPELRVELEEFVQGNQKHYIAPLRPIVQAKALLRESGYYDVGDQLFQNTFAPIVEQILGQRPTSVSGFQDLYETLKYSSPQTAALLEPINRDINSYIRSQREVFRLTHPEIQGALETLGWVNPMPTMA